MVRWICRMPLTRRFKVEKPQLPPKQGLAQCDKIPHQSRDGGIELRMLLGWSMTGGIE
jgi:hypothetical protein